MWYSNIYINWHLFIHSTLQQVPYQQQDTNPTYMPHFAALSCQKLLILLLRAYMRILARVQAPWC